MTLPLHLTSLLELFTRFWYALEHGQALPVGYWNYLFLMVFVIMQGPLTKLLGGAAASGHLLNLYMVFLISFTASLMADFFWYNVGRTGRLQNYLKKRPGNRKKMVERLQRSMHKHYAKVLLMGKLSLGMAVPALLAAGISKLPWRRWLPVVILGEGLFTSMMVLIGYFAAGSIAQVDQTLRIVGLGFTAIWLLGLVVLLPVVIKKLLLKENIDE